MKKGDLLQTLSKHLFWDVDVGTIDAETHRGFIIPRVMDRGARSDVQAIWNQYGAETIKDVLLQAPALQRKTIFFFANQFRLRPEAFRKSQEMGTWTH